MEALDAALLDGVEKAVLDPVALRYVLDQASAAVRRTLAEDPAQIETLQRRRAEVQRRITRLVDAVADGKAPRAILDEIQALEADLDRLDSAIAAVEARGHLGHLDVARAVRDLEPALAAWKDILRGSPVRARQLLKKIVAEPIRMEPLPEGQGYHWKGLLNGGAVLEGAQKYLKVRGGGTRMEQWVRSATGRRQHSTSESWSQPMICFPLPGPITWSALTSAPTVSLKNLLVVLSR